ncbi:MAG: HD domain-containing protein [Ignisphaera sp.]|uniref:HD domain-containing protein n=1 Tax=Ignisphaera aggregans TaxID=334771 RepID=A0A7C4JIN7_9CREN
MVATEGGIRGIAKRIYDEVHGYVELSNTELEIINTAIFQRLRYIKQLATAWYVYPGATHTRFSHSIGTMHIAGLVSSKLYKLGYIHDPDDIQLLRLAALLHDIGHTPFSHAIEPFYKHKLSINHEDISRVIIEESTEIKEVLNKYGFDHKEIIAVLESRYREPLYNQLLSSDVDIDRMDYLIRDALHTGVAYGTIDLQRLIATLVVDGDGNIAILDKGIDAVDNFYLARMHMYKTVYYHKTLVGYELILRRIYENLCEYYPEEVRIFKSLQDIVKAIRSEDIIYWNDDWLIGLMINVLRQRRTPKELKELIEAFFKRKGYKVLLDISNFSNQPLNVEIDKDVEIIQTIETIVKNIVEDHQVTIFVDDIKILDEDPHVVPRVVFGGKKSLPITDCTACIVKYIPRRYHVKRLYVLSGKWDRVLEELKYRGLIP